MRKTTVRKTTKKRRRRAAFLLILLITGIAVLKSGIVTKRIQREETKKAVAAEVEALHEKANRDGIVEETPDPYFIRKQPGYSYPKPKLIQYDSGITHTCRHAMVFLPADYDAAERVEGLSFTESLEPFDTTPEEVVKYLKPYIERHFSVKKGRKSTAVAGNSLGGRNALALAYKYPKQFGSVGSFSPSVSVEAANGTGLKAPLRDLNLPKNKNRPFDVLMVMVGRSDKVCGNVSYELDRYMKAQNISHDFYDTAGGHETTVWQNGLYNFAKKLYRK
ncbi:MAG: alpha/beta hydrolase [Mogibacterium kristiansenii]|uniref:alpha/beta hydrolase n=1 Tax=Mogibacterium kristiansenii TaxID=2606708 RepID=UPI003F058715